MLRCSDTERLAVYSITKDHVVSYLCVMHSTFSTHFADRSGSNSRSSPSTTLGTATSSGMACCSWRSLRGKESTTSVRRTRNLLFKSSNEPAFARPTADSTTRQHAENFMLGDRGLRDMMNRNHRTSSGKG
eukprot:6186-Heterococcus_DN1.PRE.4